MKKLLLILLCLPMIGFGQNVNIPDANFKAYLVGNTAINTNGDSEIQVSEATIFSGNISLFSGFYSDLTGIESFTALSSLSVQNNQITTLDVSQNTALTSLSVENNQITTLDVSQNTALTNLYCSSNQLTNVDISQNTSLESFVCDNNLLTNLNLSANTSLRYLQCNYNLLTSLDLSANTNLEVLGCAYNELININLSQNNLLFYLNCKNNQLTSLDLSQLSCSLQINESDFSENPNLSCIEVTDLSCWNSFLNYLDPQHYYSNNCSSPSSIQEYNTNKELLKVTDLLGREKKQTNQPIFYIYDDGTVEKRIVIE